MIKTILDDIKVPLITTGLVGTLAFCGLLIALVIILNATYTYTSDPSVPVILLFVCFTVLSFSLLVVGVLISFIQAKSRGSKKV